MKIKNFDFEKVLINAVETNDFSINDEDIEEITLFIENYVSEHQSDKKKENAIISTISKTYNKKNDYLSFNLSAKILHKLNIGENIKINCFFIDTVEKLISIEKEDFLFDDDFENINVSCIFINNKIQKDLFASNFKIECLNSTLQKEDW